MIFTVQMWVSQTSEVQVLFNINSTFHFALQHTSTTSILPVTVRAMASFKWNNLTWKNTHLFCFLFFTHFPINQKMKKKNVTYPMPEDQKAPGFVSAINKVWTRNKWDKALVDISFLACRRWVSCKHASLLKLVKHTKQKQHGFLHYWPNF